MIPPLFITGACIVFGLVMGVPLSMIIEAIVLTVIVSVALETIILLFIHPKR